MNVDVRIDKLVLDGIEVPPHQRAAVLAAAENELTRLLRDRGWGSPIAAGGCVPTLAGTDIEVGSPVDATLLGRQIAGAVHDGFGS